MGRVGESKKALVSWETMCLPKASGGLNLKILEDWNKASRIVEISLEYGEQER